MGKCDGYSGLLQMNSPYLIMFSFVENALISLFVARDSVPLNNVFEVILDL